MKLDTKVFRYLTSDDWRVLTAVEMGSKNHEVVPTPLIVQLAGLRTGSNTVHKCISTLAKADLVARVRNVRYDGYRLTYGGSDYLALHAHSKAENILRLGSQMGVGKESDIYLVTAPATAASGSGVHRNGDGNAAKPVQSILKIHRLGRLSFRSLARNRAYHRHRQHCSWQYLSRLSAQKEFAAMQALLRAGFPVPRPIAWNRHTIVMSLVPGVPLKDVPLSAFSPDAPENENPQIGGAEGADGEEADTNSHSQRDGNIAALYSACIDLALQLASNGLIHGDLNEFNILVEHVPGAFESPATPETPNITVPFETGTESEPRNRTSTATRQPKHKPMRPHLIDFPQIISLSHPSAEEFFARDISGIKSFFRKRYHFESDDAGPTFADALSRLREADAARTTVRLDIEIEAAGFSKKMGKDLELYFAEAARDGEDKVDIEQSDGEDHEDDYNEQDDTDHADSIYSSHQDVDLYAQNQLDLYAATQSADRTSSAQTCEPADVKDINKLASLSLQDIQPPSNRKTKAGVGWSI